MSKKSDAEAILQKAEQKIKELLGKRCSGKVLIKDKEVKVRRKGYGQLMVMKTKVPVCPFVCEVFQHKASTLDHTLQHDSETTRPTATVHTLDSCRDTSSTQSAALVA